MTSNPKRARRGKPSASTVEPAPRAPARGQDPTPEPETSRHRALLDSVLDPTIAIDAHGEIVVASRSVERVLGWKPEELIGRNVRVLMPEPHHALHDEYLANYRRTGTTHILGRTRLFEVRCKDGELRSCELSISRTAAEKGREPLFVGTFRDVTDRVRAERALLASEQRFRVLFDRSIEYIGLLDVEGNVLEANQASLDGAGLRREDVIGKPFWETRWWQVGEREQERLKAAIRAAAAGEFVRFQTRHRGLGDELLTIDFSLNPVFDADGRVEMLIPEGRDITALKRAQEAETGMLRALATIGESAAVLAHEIKNPITAVNLALRAVAHQLGADQQAVLEDLVARMQRLERIMRRTLTFSKPLDLSLRRIQVGDLLRDAVRTVRPEIVRRGAEVSTQVERGDLFFEADPGLLEEVLTNLVKNSLEAHGHRVRVTLSAADEPPAGVLLAVEDDGPGVPESLCETLFNPFVTTKKEGTGLGLAFSRKVVEAHGGSIEVDRSIELGGARFRIHMPYSPFETPAEDLK